MFRRTRLAASAVATLTCAGLVAAPASASTPGVGSTQTKTTVLAVQLGQNGALLNLSLLADSGSASIDPHVTPSATAKLSPLTVSSSVASLNAAAPAIVTQAPGGQTDSSGQGVSLTSLGVPSALATGTIRAASLHSDFVSMAAHSTMSAAEIDNLSVAGGGVLSVDLLSSSLGANAITTDADGARGVNIGTVKLLDLGALLKGLGIDLASLPVPTVSALLTQLGAVVPGLPAGVNLATFVSQLNSTITALRATLNATLTQVTGTVDTTTGGLLGQLGLPVPTSTSTVAQVNGVIDQVQATLVAVLTSGLSALDSAPLATVAATQFGISTKAADTLANSSVGVTAAPLKVTVAGVTLPTLDPTTAANAVNAALATANTALNTLVGTLGLPANLITVSVLDQAKSLTTSGGYTQAVAAITGLTIKVAPIDPAVVTGAISKLTGQSVGSLLGGAVPQVPVATAMAAVNTLLGLAAPLTGGALVQIASLTGSSSFAPAPASPLTPAAPAGPSSLPRTGGHPALALLGVLVALLAMGAVRRARRTVPAPVSDQSRVR